MISQKILRLLNIWSVTLKKYLFLILLAISWQSHAERWFDVEVILFKNNVAAGNAGEYWPEPDKIDMSNIVKYNNKSGLAKYQIEPLPKNKFELTDYYNQLAKSEKYKNLLHIGWRQNDNGRAQMPKIGLPAGKKVGNGLELDGYIRLYVDHYLFLETDLMLQEPITKVVNKTFDPTSNVELGKNYETYLQGINFKQKRRMRSGEIHFLDHPLAGIIIQVRRLDQES